MANRREFLKHVTAASAGLALFGRGSHALTALLPQTGGAGPAKRREIKLGGRTVKTVNAHAHTFVPEVTDLVKGTPLERPAAAIAGQLGGGGGGNPARIAIGPGRLEKMDADGIDVEALSVNPFWYAADRDMASRLIDLQNEKLAAMVAKFPDRFVAYGTVALQFPDLAAQQLEEGMKRWGMRGAAIGGNVEGEELSAPKYDPFWAKAEELQALIFMHPQDSAAATGVAKRVQGNGGLGNVVGNPLETTIFLSHLILEGTFDRFPNLKLLAAHGGGYLPSYPSRMDAGCVVFAQNCKVPLKKHPSEYLKQIYVDSMVYTPENIRHLAAVCGPGQVVIGTDSPIPWVPDSPIDPILATPGLSDADKTAMIGGTACKLLRIPT